MFLLQNGKRKEDVFRLYLPLIYDRCTRSYGRLQHKHNSTDQSKLILRRLRDSSGAV